MKFTIFKKKKIKKVRTHKISFLSWWLYKRGVYREISYSIFHKKSAFPLILIDSMAFERHNNTTKIEIHQGRNLINVNEV